MTQEKELKGIHGWLTLFVVGLILSILISLGFLLETFLPNYINNKALFTILDPNSSFYHPELAYVVIYEAIINVLMIIMTFILLSKVSKLKKYVPTLVMWFLITKFAFTLIDELWLNNSAEILKLIGTKAGNYTNSLHNGFYLLVWGSYFASSKRVKNTFIK